MEEEEEERAETFFFVLSVSEKKTFTEHSSQEQSQKLRMTVLPLNLGSQVVHQKFNTLA